MLAKARRLPRLEFLQLKKTAQSRRTSDFSYIYMPSTTSKVAIVTSSKLSKKAVIRNYLRRQIYAYFQNITLSGDIIIFPTASMLNLGYEETRARLHSVLSTLTRS